MTGKCRVELESYKINDVTHIWYTQWSDPRTTLTSVTVFIVVMFDVSPETPS